MINLPFLFLLLYISLLFLFGYIDSFKTRSNASGTKILESYAQLQNAYLLDAVKDKLLEKYDEKFFENNVLYTSFISDTSSNAPYNVRCVERTDDEITVNIEKISGGSYSDDVCKKMICLGVPKSVYNTQKLNVKNEKSIVIGEKHIEDFGVNNLTACLY